MSLSARIFSRARTINISFVLLELLLLPLVELGEVLLLLLLLIIARQWMYVEWNGISKSYRSGVRVVVSSVLDVPRGGQLQLII